MRYEAREGYVWDWVEPHITEEGEEEHLYAKILYLAIGDAISNYVEVQI